MTSDDDYLSAFPPDSPLARLLSSCSETPQELERQERAAQRLRERCLSIPYYRERDAKEGMEFFRDLHASAILSN